MRKDSWHYKLAKIGNDNNEIWDGCMSICQYTRKVLWGGVLALFITTFVSIAAGWLIFGFLQICGAIIGFNDMGPAGWVLIGLVSFIGIVSVWMFGKETWTYKSRDLLREDNKSFVASAYKSYKEKICFSVHFEE